MDRRWSILLFTLSLLGLSAPGVGIWLLASTDIKYVFQVTHLNKDPLIAAAMLMIIAAIFLIVTMVISFYESWLCGSVFIWLKLHIGFTSLLLGFSLMMIISSGIFIDSISSEIEVQMRLDVKTKYTSEWNSDPVSSSWDQMQTDWKCCGGSNYTDYHNSTYSAVFQEPVPWTCCVMSGDDGDSILNVVNETACRIEAQSPKLTEALYLHTKGCYRKIDSVLDEASVAALVVSCLLFVIEVIGLVLSVLRKRDMDITSITTGRISRGCY